MSRSKAKPPLIPRSNARYRPDIERQRMLLVTQRDFYRDKGFEIELNLEAHLTQTLSGDPAAIEKERDGLREQIMNCDRSARRMDAMLAKLPASKKARPERLAGQ